MLWILDGMLFHSILYRWAGHVARLLMKYLPRGLIYTRFNIWGNTRELPDLPDMSFREWYKKGQHDD
jgi:L-lactate dehydrogenase complex protein LldF